MAEILCGVPSSAEQSAAVDAPDESSRVARSKRMVVRRCRIAEAGEARALRVAKRRGLGGVSYGASSVAGRRREMEDAVSTRPEFVAPDRGLHFFGVFDGHGCSHVAESCRDRFHELVAEEVRVMGAEEQEEEAWVGAMERGFARMDTEVVLRDEEGEDAGCPRCGWRSGKSERVGSTAVAAIITPRQIVIANCGDSRAVLLRGDRPLPLSSDHKPDRADELQRIQAAGGKVIYWEGPRVLGVLAMSRAIGDHYLKPYVTAVPEVTITRRTDDDECLVMASDGLWDVISNDTACQVARTCLQKGMSMPEVEGIAGGSDGASIRAAVLLTKLAITRGSADNISVVVVDLKKRTRSSKSGRPAD